MSATSQAMVFDGAGKPLEALGFPLPRPAPGEVVVEVACCTLCGSDLHTFQGRRSTPCPTVLGHEILGRVWNVNGTVCDTQGTPLQIGDRVTWSVVASCGDCFFCTRDLPQKCERLFKYGHERITDQHPLNGGLAHHCQLVAGTAIMRVPAELPDEVACPANCATATVAGAFRLAGSCRDQIVLVQGAGMLGLTACAMARHLGAARVIACDIDSKRLERAEQFGATHTFNPDEGPLKEWTHGRGVDLALEFSGSPAAMEQGIEWLRIGGRAVLVGAVFPTRPAAVAPEMIVRKLLTLRGLHNYIPADLATALDFLTHAHTLHPFAELVEARFPLADADAAFHHAIHNRSLRVAVTPA